jgi:Uma2 family endonuclease
LCNVPWESYLAIGDALPDRPDLRMNYDGENLELMTFSPKHEFCKARSSRLIETLAEEFNLKIVPGGSMTFRPETIRRGFEPDSCFWIAHEEHMRGRLDWDPKRDPPPDLILEIEISRSVLDRLSIFAALGVPEIWRCDGKSLTVHLLQPNGTYQKSPGSPTFPGIAVSEIVGFMQPSDTIDYLSLVRAFRDWVREQLAGKKKAAGNKTRR